MIITSKKETSPKSGLSGWTLEQQLCQGLRLVTATQVDCRGQGLKAYGRGLLEERETLFLRETGPSKAGKRALGKGKVSHPVTGYYSSDRLT